MEGRVLDPFCWPAQKLAFDKLGVRHFFGGQGGGMTNTLVWQLHTTIWLPLPFLTIHAYFDSFLTAWSLACSASNYPLSRVQCSFLLNILCLFLQIHSPSFSSLPSAWGCWSVHMASRASTSMPAPSPYPSGLEVATAPPLLAQDRFATPSSSSAASPAPCNQCFAERPPLDFPSLMAPSVSSSLYPGCLQHLLIHFLMFTNFLFT